MAKGKEPAADVLKRGPDGRLLPGGKRHPRAGRRKGVPNKLNGDLRTAIIEASELAGTTLGARAAAKGEKGHPKGLLGYLYHLALSEPRTMGALLKETLPKVQKHEGQITLTELVTGSWRREAEGMVDLGERFPGVGEAALPGPNGSHRPALPEALEADVIDVDGGDDEQPSPEA